MYRAWCDVQTSPRRPSGCYSTTPTEIQARLANDRIMDGVAAVEQSEDKSGA
jgi:hypothetical protein